ncbi:MAG: glycoside hydrolase family 27 protein [Chitinophagaceae bacterium]
MGWSSWNSFRINITEKDIREEANLLVSTGLKNLGYAYAIIDDGYFGGRNTKGNIIPHPKRFPGGMKSLADYIHSKGLKAGIYSDAGINTCASYWDKDTIATGCGLYGHEYQDLFQLLNTWGYDYIKVDWCGGDWMKLNQQTRYTLIGNIIREIKPETHYSICSWGFPGEWVTTVGNMWRISSDIRSDFKAIMRIVDLNADLWKYATPGHINDMDMLQVGNGMSYEEDKTHFTMWAVMSSPLLLGNDLRKMSKETMQIISNKEIIALNQDPLVYQARRFSKKDSLEIWARPLGSTTSGKVAITLLNRNDREKEISFDLDSVGINSAKGYTLRDLWMKKDYPQSMVKKRSFKVPAHGVVVLKAEGVSHPFNKYQYE